MGGMGGGMGGMGGGMMGGGGGTMPATMGMMMLGRLIMSLVGDRDSWDQTSLMSGMMGGMGGMGMGGMGGMGGGMGMGGMGGGMGGGFRSVPPTSLPFASLKAGQTRHLPTRLVSLSRPNGEGSTPLPEEGETLRIDDIGRLNGDARVATAMKRLAEDKAPTAISQIVMWRVAGELGWDEIAERANGSANAYELTLAKSFVNRLKSLPDGESGVLLYHVEGAGTGDQKAARAINEMLKDKSVLGLKTEPGVPARPKTPAVACTVRVQGNDAAVQLAISDGEAKTWTPSGKFHLPLTWQKDALNTNAFADALASGLLDRLVRARLSPGPRVKGRPSYKLKVENASPLVLNGFAVLGKTSEEGETPKVLSGICIPPFRSMTVPATETVVKDLGLKKGVRVIAADLSGL
jgi:hypothetical protein